VNYQARPPQSPPPIFLEIDRAMRLGKLSLAIALARQALNAGYANPVLYNLRAHGLRLDGRPEEALADMRQALSLEPNSAVVMAEIADCLNSLGRYKQALAAADDAIAVDRTMAKAWLHKGLALQHLSELNDARTAFLEATRLDPNMADAHARLAALANISGAHDEVRKYAAKAEAVHPGHPIATIALVATELAEGKFERAEPRLAALLRDPDAPPLMRANALSHLGDLRDAQGRTHEAFDAYCRSKALWRAAYEGQHVS
jgi:tetratricopeptide (TPR) repeat protein